MKYNLALRLTAALGLFVAAELRAKELSSKNFDFNGDGKTDYVEVSSGERLVRIEEDTDGTGVLDKVTTIHESPGPTDAIRTTTYDADGDGKPERRERVYFSSELKKKFLLVEVAEKKAGVFDHRFAQLLSPSRERDCGEMQPEASPEVAQLLSSVSAIQHTLSGELLSARPNHEVHRSCLERWGHPQFVNVLQKSIEDGLKCLGTLANKPPQPLNGAAMNIVKLNHLFQGTKVSVNCQHKMPFDSDAIAQASVAPGDRFPGTSLEHPYVVLAPSTPARSGAPSAAELRELRVTLFHEQLHNLGIAHGEGIEYPYACEDCCMVGSAGKDAACRVCRGEYAGGANSEMYVIDLYNWGGAIGDLHHARVGARNLARRVPNNPFGHALVAMSQSDTHNAIGIEYARLFEARYTNLSLPLKEILAQSRKLQNSETIKWGQRFGQPIGQALFEHLHNRDNMTAVRTLQTGLPVLRELVRHQNSGQPDQRKAARLMTEVLSDFLWEIQLSEVPGSTSAAGLVASNLRKELGIP